MKRLIENWVHIPGIHCGSVTLRDVMTFFGHPWTEEMCFGIGGGLGFYYTVGENISPTHMIFMRGPGMETSFFSLVVEKTEWKQAEAGRAVETVKGIIDSGIPAIIQTDIFYLHYYKSSTHFPGHIISVWGYDDEKGVVYVADTQFEGLKTVSYDDLEESMGSSAPPNPLHNNYLDMVVPQELRPLSELAPEAIRINARKMADGVTGGRGESAVRLIKAWAEDMPSWRDVHDWKWCARFGYQVIKKRGVGGAGFRWIYRDFLKEAEAITPGISKLGLPEKMDRIGERWSEAADLLKEISERGKPEKELLKKASSVAAEIYGMETKYYNYVLEKLGGK
ncbi:MAG: BtrH N-terminal domain-containing protein [Thermodesulfobacteriota bacterium]